MFLFFPVGPGRGGDRSARDIAGIASFSRIMRRTGNERFAGRLCRRRVQPSSTHCPDAAAPIRWPNRLRPGAAGSVA